MKTGVELIADERRRQIEAEGFGPEHDAQHDESELLWAACYYAMPCMTMEGCSCGRAVTFDPNTMFQMTGWHHQWAKRHWPPATWPRPSGARVRDMVKAGALIAAEIDRLQVAESEAAPNSPED